MAVIDALCASLAGVLRSSAARRPVLSLGVVLEQEDGQAAVAYADALGVALFRDSAEALPPALRRLDATEWVVLDPGADPEGFLERRLLMTGFKDELRGRFAPRRTVALAVPDWAPRAAVVLGLGQAELGADELAAELRQVAASVAGILRAEEPLASQLERLRRLELVGALLPGLFQVLDVRDIFDRLSVISQEVVPHDVMALGFFSADGKIVETYAQASA